jgi:hypothetical protein
MTVSTYTKTASVELLATQLLTVDANGSTAPATAISAAQDVSTKIAATVYVRFGRAQTTALAAGCRFRIEGSSETGAVNDFWWPIYEWASSTAAAESEAIATANAASGQKVIQMASTTNLVAGDIIFIYESGTVANSEWARINAVTATPSILVEDNLTRTHNIGVTIYDQAEMWAIPVDLAGVVRLRLVVDFQTGQTDTHVACVGAEMVTLDSVTSV